MSESSSADSSSAPASAADEQEPEQPEEFLNRAARRAKGKKGGRSDSLAPGASQPHGREVVQNRRQFGNRRTGG
jgi:hypothetical protein